MIGTGSNEVTEFEGDSNSERVRYGSHPIVVVSRAAIRGLLFEVNELPEVGSATRRCGSGAQVGRGYSVDQTSENVTSSGQCTSWVVSRSCMCARWEDRVELCLDTIDGQSRRAVAASCAIYS